MGNFLYLIIMNKERIKDIQHRLSLISITNFKSS